MAVDYLSALNVGSGLNVTQIVDAIVEAEKVPQETIIQKKMNPSQTTKKRNGTLKVGLAQEDRKSVVKS